MPCDLSPFVLGQKGRVGSHRIRRVEWRQSVTLSLKTCWLHKWASLMKCGSYSCLRVVTAACYSDAGMVNGREGGREREKEREELKKGKKKGRLIFCEHARVWDTIYDLCVCACLSLHLCAHLFQITSPRHALAPPSIRQRAFILSSPPVIPHAMPPTNHTHNQRPSHTLRENIAIDNLQGENLHSKPPKKVKQVRCEKWPLTRCPEITLHLILGCFHGAWLTPP